MSNLWIKLWTETLSDPKVARLPDREYRRWIEVLLLAGYRDEDGKLPDIDDICWMLHQSSDEVTRALEYLAIAGLVHRDDDRWVVTNFAKRQETDAAKRMRRMRERNRQKDQEQLQGNSYGNSYAIDSTSTSTSTSTSLININKNQEIRKLFDLYEAEIGTITKSISEKLEAAWGEYDHGWFDLAFSEAAGHNARNWKYVEAILKRWKSDGFQSKNGKGGGAKKESIFDQERRKIAAEEAAKHGE